MTCLKYGTYYLEETKAPEKYVPLTNRVAFTVDEQSYVTAGQLISPEKIPNKHKGTLPSTGGKGIYVYIGAGVVLLLIAGFCKNWKKEQRITQMLLFLLLSNSHHKENTNETKEKETSRSADAFLASLRNRDTSLSIC